MDSYPLFPAGFYPRSSSALIRGAGVAASAPSPGHAILVCSYPPGNTPPGNGGTAHDLTTEAAGRIWLVRKCTASRPGPAGRRRHARKPNRRPDGQAARPAYVFGFDTLPFPAGCDPR